MSELIEIKPGQSLLIRTEGNGASIFSLPELRELLRPRWTKVSHRSKTPGSKFSRHLALSLHALEKGKWSTGAKIDRIIVLTALQRKFDLLPESEYSNITPAAMKALTVSAGTSHALDAILQQILTRRSI
jgi:hypothetical protein